MSELYTMRRLRVPKTGLRAKLHNRRLLAGIIRDADDKPVGIEIVSRRYIGGPERLIHEQAMTLSVEGARSAVALLLETLAEID